MKTRSEKFIVWNHHGRDVVMSGTPEEIVDAMRKSGLIIKNREAYKKGVASRVSMMFDEYIPTRTCGEFLEALIKAGLMHRIN